MKSTAILLVWLVTAGTAFASTNDLAGLVQRGLFEEEANHQLEAAVRDYQGAIDQYDHDRQLAATAIFRLAECDRKLGQTNEAAGLYRRIAREFPDRRELVEASQPYLAQSESARATTPFGIGSKQGNQLLRRLKDLVKNNPDLMNYSVLGETPLDQAVRSDDIEAAEFALQHGADPNKTSATQSPLLRAIGMDYPDCTNMVQLLLTNGADPNLEGQEGITALMAAVMKANKQLIEILLTNRADINKRSRNDTPLEKAVDSGFNVTAELLLSNHANVHSDHDAPIFLAVENGRTEMVQLLLRYQADPNATNYAGKTVLEEAKDPQVRAVLLAAGADPLWERRHGIFVATAPDGEPQKIFSCLAGSGDRFTLLELVGEAYNGQDSIPFPDFTNAYIERISANGNARIPVHIAEILRATNRAADIPLQWGDVLRIPQVDHRVTEFWRWLPAENYAALNACLARTVKIIAHGATNDIRLVLLHPNDMRLGMPTAPNGIVNNFILGGTPLPFNWNPAGVSPAGKSGPIASFRLWPVIQQAAVLFISSDLTHVRLTRPFHKVGTKVFEFDLSHQDNPDVYLDDGDVIVISDRAP